VETLVERCAGLDVHTDSVTACVRVPDGHAGRHAETRRFTTTTAGLGLLAEWLASFGVTRVGMESTGCYWKPIWQLLEGQVECWLLNAAHLHNVPGRKTDVADAVWICQLVEHGLVRPSFVPPKPIRELRELTRYRKTQIQERSREAPAAGSRSWEDAGTRAVECGHRHHRGLWPGDAGSPGGRHPRPGAAGRVGQEFGSGPSCQRCGRPWPAGSAPTITGCWSPTSWPTSSA
jgi:hypothetical protein